MRAERAKPSHGRVFIIVEVGVIGRYLSRGLDKRGVGESWAPGHLVILSNGRNIRYSSLHAGSP